LKNQSADVSIIFERLQNCVIHKISLKLIILYHQAFMQKSNAKATLSQLFISGKKFRLNLKARRTRELLAELTASRGG
jgi:hypothetical protein